MAQEDQDNALKKEALKQLRQSRKRTVEAATARMKEQRQAVKAIKKSLAEAELTVPQIAAATGLAASEVLWYVASLKKYGEVLEGSQDGSYYRYRLAQPLAAEAEPGFSE